MADKRLGTVVKGPGGAQFRLQQFLGGGAFGRVFKASGLVSPLIVAVKMPPEDKISDPTTLAFRSVLNEMTAEMMKVKHPNVVQVLYADPGTDSSIGPYIIMEYVEGYKAPEGWRQEKNTYKMDVYSVGLVYYQILTLEHPLLQYVPYPSDYDRWREVHLTIPCGDVREKRPDVSAAVARLMLRMVDKSTGNRPDWNEVIKELTPSVAAPRSGNIDSTVLAAMNAQVDEHFRKGQAKTEEELKRIQDGEREGARRTEYADSAKRLLSRFDEVVKEYQDQGTGYRFEIVKEDLGARRYTLMNGRVLSCNVFPYKPTDGLFGSILGAAYLGVEGGLSTNLALMGNQNDVGSAHWNPVQVTLSGIVTDLERWYREAGVSRETMGFLEYEHGGEPWRRDFASYFGFRAGDSFYEKYGRSRGMGAYNFQVPPIGPLDAFNEILSCGIRIPSRG